MDACRHIRETAADGAELRVYACGGDGTLNECVNGAAGLPNTAVTHFPCGTGNDFIRMFDNEKSRFYDLTELINGEVRPLDVIKCNDRYAINICSLGIDARVGTDVHKYSGLPLVGGAAGYVVSLAVNYVKGVTTSLTAATEGLDLRAGAQPRLRLQRPLLRRRLQPHERRPARRRRAWTCSSSPASPACSHAGVVMKYANGKYRATRST